MNGLSGPILTAAQMLAAEQASGVPLDILMERAGSALAETAWRYGVGAPVLVLCGPGNNGGDGYVAARLLQARGADVRVAAFGGPKTGLAKAVCAGWTGAIDALSEADAAPVLIDALFGTGVRALSDDIMSPLGRLANAAQLVVAADLPSGVGADDGRDGGAIAADVTIAFGAVKPGHLLQPGAARCGQVFVADIGILPASGWHVLSRPRLAPPAALDHKYTRGMVAVVGGAMAGAGALAAIAAARSGSGYVIALGIEAALPHAIVRRGDDALDAVLGDARVGAVVIGPGLGHDARARTMLTKAQSSDRALVIDGDGLQPGTWAPRGAPTILTPHAGEFARLFGGSDASKIERAIVAAQRCAATIIFKGADTVIASPDGRVTVAPPASAWLSTAGTGDVLAGIAGAMLARGLDAHEAAAAAVWLHGAAAAQAGAAFIADDLPAHVAAML